MQLGTKLNRLIKTRSYTLGRRTRLETERQRLMRRIAEIDSKQLELGVALVLLDSEITASSAINTSEIRATKPSQRLSKAPHGATMRGVVAYLRRSGGRPIRSDELQEVVRDVSGYDALMRTKLKQRTSYVCHILKKRGWLERLNDEQTCLLPLPHRIPAKRLRRSSSVIFMIMSSDNGRDSAFMR
ncbi:MAG: hypothetical protein Q7K20_07830 [Polaromonas sp.]|jgi:hypothetical protein|nr:hypothetical protein [Polaromonas sp.]